MKNKRGLYFTVFTDRNSAANCNIDKTVSMSLGRVDGKAVYRDFFGHEDVQLRESGIVHGPKVEQNRKPLEGCG